MTVEFSSLPAIFQPIEVGEMRLAHRVILAPQTRLRNTSEHVPTDLVTEWYAQRARVPGTLLIAEATYISPQASGWPFAPGIWNDQQISAWRKVTDAVHTNGSFICLQLWAMGRAARPQLLHKMFPDYPHVSPSPIPLSEHPNEIPRELSKEEIKEYVEWYAGAAKNAVKAGFDGVEVHGAGGYLIDQFLQDLSNKRTDEYGGSIENRARFALEVMDAVVAAVGAKRSAIRFSPWQTYQDMRMEDPIPQFSYVVEQLKVKHPDLAYIHVVGSGAGYSKGPDDPSQEYFLNNIWAPRPMITCGGFTRESALKVAEETGQLVGFAGAFSANPDLPFRLREEIELNGLNYGTLFGPPTENGYTDYPFCEEFQKLEAKTQVEAP